MRRCPFIRALTIGALVPLTTLILSVPRVCMAQGASARPEPNLRDAVGGEWAQVTAKVIAMAEDFPEGKYDFRPVPGVRTFADQLRHVAFWNLFVVKSLKGEKIDPAINEVSKTDYPTKASIVAVLSSIFSTRRQNRYQCLTGFVLPHCLQGHS